MRSFLVFFAPVFMACNASSKSNVVDASDAASMESSIASTAGGPTTSGGNQNSTSSDITSTAAAGVTGSSSSGGGAAPDEPDKPNQTPHVVRPCPGVDSAGVWEEITPREAGYPNWCVPKWNDECPAPGRTTASGVLATYGTNAVAIDPNDTATVYLGTSSLGMYKSTDCGASWVHINTGRYGEEIDKGRSWSLVVDPVDSQVIYTTAGYGMGDVFKSTDGGVNWEPMLTPDVREALAGGFVEKITIDPTDHLHLLASPHGPCVKDGAEYACLAESKDGGETWTLTNSAQQWSEGDGQTMINATTWFFGNQFGGIWRTTNAGATWTSVYTGNADGDVYTASDGSFYSCALNTILHSADGISWGAVPNGKPCGANSNGGAKITGFGDTMFISRGASGTPPAGGWYWSTKDTDPSNWKSLESPASMGQGGVSIAYDPDHRILYSSNYVSGFWRVVVP